MQYPKGIENLIDLLTKLPSVGPKTAERYVFHFLNQNPEELQKLAQAIAELREKITICRSCLSVAEADPCFICSDKKRQAGLLCVAANTRDMLNIESTGQYRGYYHILGGLIDTIAGITHENLNIKQLENRLKKEKIKELILALSPNMEGETTAIYLTKQLKKYNIIITRLAQGLSSGTSLEYADPMTLSNAFKNRISL